MPIRCLKFRTMLFPAVLLIILAMIIACGEEATEAPAPTAAPTDAPTVARAAPAAVTQAPAAATAAPVAATVAPAATPTAAPAPADTPTPAMMVQEGTFDFSVPEMGPPNFGLSIQDYQPQKTDNITTHEAMFATSPDGLTVPRLVTEWEVDAAGLVYTFHLREGVPWHTNLRRLGESSTPTISSSPGRKWLSPECHTPSLVGPAAPSLVTVAR